MEIAPGNSDGVPPGKIPLYGLSMTRSIRRPTSTTALSTSRGLRSGNRRPGTGLRRCDLRAGPRGAAAGAVKREGQHQTEALLGVNRKTVALALRRERLTGRTNHAVQTLIASVGDPEWKWMTPLDRMESRLRLASSASDTLVERYKLANRSHAGHRVFPDEIKPRWLRIHRPRQLRETCRIDSRIR